MLTPEPTWKTLWQSPDFLTLILSIKTRTFPWLPPLQDKTFLACYDLKYSLYMKYSTQTAVEFLSKLLLLSYKKEFKKAELIIRTVLAVLV